MKIIFRLEQNKEALKDADTALEYDERNNKAIAAKAEALFNSGLFERALVQFEKGNKIRKNSNTTIGLIKCRQAILSSIGQQGIVFEKGMVTIAIRETKLEKERKEKRKKEKTSEWSSLLSSKNKAVVEVKPKRSREPTLKFSNLLHEEDLFLQRLTGLEKLNFIVDDKRGSRTAQVMPDK